MSTREPGVGDDIRRRVLETVADDGVTRAEAIRRVAADLGRTVSSTSSAFYAAERRAKESPEAAAASVPRPASSSASTTARRAARSGSRQRRQLFAEMLPLVEAGASPEQAARRFGPEEDAHEIAAEFREWQDAGAGDGDAGADSVAERHQRIGDASARITSLEAENRVLRAELGRVNLTLSRLRAILDAAED